MKTIAAEKVSPRFRMQRLNDFYYAWSAAAADFNRDGIMDMVAGPYIYFGPDYTTSREIYLAHTWNPSREYASDCMGPVRLRFHRRRLARRPDHRPFRRHRRHPVREPERRIAALGQIPGGARHPDRDHAAEGHRWGRQARVDLRSRRVHPYAKPDPAEADRSRGSSITFPSEVWRRRTASAWATSTATGGWISSTRTDGGSSRRRAARRSRGRIIRRLSAVGTVPAAGRRHDGGVRRQRRRSERRGDQPAGARFRARLVRAEARRGRQDLLRPAHDHGRLLRPRTPAA